MMARKAIPDRTVTEVLVRSRRRCCLCYGLERDDDIKLGQIAHIDRNHGNPDFDNLAYLCLAHHDQYDSVRSQSKGFTQGELRYYRDELYAMIAEKFNMLNDFLKDADYEPTPYDGVYSYKHPVMEASITIRHIKDDIYSIDGTALYGTDRPVGPNIGQLSEIGTLRDGALTYTDYNQDEQKVEYGIRIEFDGDKIHVSELGMVCGFNGRFGAGARFSGDYKKTGA